MGLNANSMSDSALLRARSEWDGRFGEIARNKRNWQLATLGLLLANLALTATVAWLSTQSRVTPFVVEVDQLGQAASFGPAERLHSSDERLIRYQLGVVISDLRTVLTDPEAQKELLTRAYAYARGSAVSFLNDWFSHRNPFELARRSRVDIRIQSILPLSDHTWQVQWVETIRSPGGKSAQTENWRALLSVEIDPPETTETLLVNPLGLYVTEISWTQTL